MKALIKKLIGEVNILYLRKLIPTKVEKEEYARRKIFYGSFLEKGDLVFDVGANFGNRVSPLLAVGARVVAVEPQDFCAKYLQKKFGSSIELVREGLSEKEEVREFFVSNAHTVSSFNQEWIDKMKEGRFKDSGAEWKKAGEIRMTTLDNLITKYGEPAFIKIDVEGFELEVLKGLSRPVKMLSIEYAVPDHLELVNNCMDRIREIYGENIECNYSTGESARWKLDGWLGYDEMREHIASEKFIKTSFGDIYVRQKKSN